MPKTLMSEPANGKSTSVWTKVRSKFPKRNKTKKSQPKFHTPFLDRVQAMLWPLQIGNIGIMRAIQMLPTLLLALLVLWAAVGWQPWQYANQWIREHTTSTFQFNGVQLTLGVLVFLIIAPWIISLFDTDDDGNKRGPDPPHRLLIMTRYIIVQLISDPVGTLVIFLIPIKAGLDPRFWMWTRPWYWRPQEWPWWPRIGVTIILMLAAYIISRAIHTQRRLAFKNRVKRDKENAKPPSWLVIWHWQMVIALVVADRYATMDKSAGKTTDVTGRQEELSGYGDRRIGVAPIISPFGTQSRWPAIQLRIRPAYIMPWEDMATLMERLFHALGNLQPMEIELQYNVKSPFGYLVLYFAPPRVDGASNLIPSELLGDPDWDDDGVDDTDEMVRVSLSGRAINPTASRPVVSDADNAADNSVGAFDGPFTAPTTKPVIPGASPDAAFTRQMPTDESASDPTSWARRARSNLEAQRRADEGRRPGKGGSR
jgi:hypothetical protein